MATIHQIADHKPKHRRPPSSLPSLSFPGNDVISEPAIPIESYARALLAAGASASVMDAINEPELASAMRALTREDKRTILSWPRRNPMASPA
jgi:hypothetical protein